MDLPARAFHPAPAFAAAFGRLFWAFLFLGVTVGPTVTVGGDQFTIDLLPDFVGYLLIASAANRLLPLGPQARSIRNLALALNFLALPGCVQYHMDLAKAGDMISFLLPLFALGLVVAVLDMVLVWKLCGLVAALARDADARRTEASALSRRKLYVLGKALFAGLVLVALVSPGLLVLAVVVALALGVTLMALLMGLMKQAQRIYLSGLVAVPDAGPGAAAAPSRWTLVVGVLGALLPLLLAAGVLAYYVGWTNARDELRRTEGSAAPRRVQQDFLAAISARRLEDAYGLTTAAYKARVSWERFVELAERYLAYRNRPNRTARGSGGGGSGGLDSFSEYEYGIDAEGRYTKVWVSVGRERDSIFSRRPPPLGVDDFTVEEGSRPNPTADPFGRNPPFGK
jgi:hypothetical protein